MSFLSKLFGNTKIPSGKIQRLTPADYRRAISGKGVQLLDVRTSAEYEGGHIKGARNLDIFKGKAFEAGIQGLTKDKPVYVYCRSGARSQRAARRLLKSGFTEIYDLNGGYLAW